MGNLKSSLDTHNYDPDQFKQEPPTPEKVEYTMISKKSTAIKVKDLSSDVLGCGDPAAKYANMGNQQSIVVDLDLRGLSDNIREEDIKKIA